MRLSQQWVCANVSGAGRGYYGKPGPVVMLPRAVSIQTPSNSGSEIAEMCESSSPRGRGDKLSPRNDHLGYAITWYALAAVLLIVFVVYHRKQVQ